jgi:hypothetical protein
MDSRLIFLHCVYIRWSDAFLYPLHLIGLVWTVRGGLPGKSGRHYSEFRTDFSSNGGKERGAGCQEKLLRFVYA